MSFEIAYLTSKEQHDFAKRAIYSPFEQCGNLGNRGGCPNLGCVLDRERKIYLFYCGSDSYDCNQPENNHYFALVWDDVTANSAIGAVFQKRYLPNTTGCNILRDVIWHSGIVYIPVQLRYHSDVIIELLQDALETFGATGDPDFERKRSVTIEFHDSPIQYIEGQRS